jgi:uncharacterized membrane protein HdeD (DUF308 family)
MNQGETMTLHIQPLDLKVFSKNWYLFLLWGIALTVLGLAAISAATFTTIATVIFLGILILLSGVVVIVDTFTFWWGQWRGFFLHLLMGVLYTAVGIMLVQTPVEGSMSLTLILGILYVLLGASRLSFSLSTRLPRWKWSCFNGVISLLLGILILANWPESSLFIIGLFVGIDLLFCGISYVMTALAARSLSQ